MSTILLQNWFQINKNNTNVSYINQMLFHWTLYIFTIKVSILLGIWCIVKTLYWFDHVVFVNTVLRLFECNWKIHRRIKNQCNFSLKNGFTKNYSYDEVFNILFSLQWFHMLVNTFGEFDSFVAVNEFRLYCSVASSARVFCSGSASPNASWFAWSSETISIV